jgi:hypothetical protein
MHPQVPANGLCVLFSGERENGKALGAGRYAVNATVFCERNIHVHVLYAVHYSTTRTIHAHTHKIYSDTHSHTATPPPPTPTHPHTHTPTHTSQGL